VNSGISVALSEWGKYGSHYGFLFI